jgi:hypothetical protein
LSLMVLMGHCFPKDKISLRDIFYALDLFA